MRRLLATIVLSLTVLGAAAAPPAFIAADVPEARLAGGVIALSAGWPP